MTTTQQYRDTRIDVRLVLSALWTTTLFVFAYVDIFGFHRADLLVAVARVAWRWPQVRNASGMTSA